MNHGNFKDLTNKKFGKLLVIKHDSKHKDGHSKWLCRCDCGNEKVVFGNNLKVDKSSCGCDQKIRMSILGKSAALPVGEAAFNGVYYDHVNSAKRRKIITELTKEQVKILSFQNCSICNCPPSNIKKGKNGDCMYNGIDRINNNLGYFIDNVRTMCIICNRAKSNLTEEEFQIWVARMRCSK